MLKLRNITVKFGNNHVLRDISCDIQHGDFIVIVGANGAGKSTFFDTIAGKIKPYSGSIILDSCDVTYQTEQQRARSITRIFQNTQLNSVGIFTVAQNLALANYSRRCARLVNGMQAMPRHQAEQLMQALGMPVSMLDKPMNALSGGQRQLIAFAMATLSIPKILLLDEPTAALDPQAATTLLSYANKFINHHAITTLLITHDPYIALSIGNKIWVLDNGRITQQYNGQEKAQLNPDKLIGNIDYTRIALAS